MSLSLDHGLINEPHPRKILQDERRKYLCRKMLVPCLFIGINVVSFGLGYFMSSIYDIDEDGSL